MIFQDNLKKEDKNVFIMNKLQNASKQKEKEV
ncbi:MAG: hypothetical protein ACFWUE_12465 [Xylanivirga thermophila]